MPNQDSIAVPIRLVIPTSVDFSALRLARGADGQVAFDWGPIEAICAASGLDVTLFRETGESNVVGLIVAWYAEHRRRGGAPDAIADDLITETVIEDALGEGLSHPPGRA